MDIKLICGDCYEYLDDFRHIDCLITDPPWGIQYNPKRKRLSTQPGRNRDNWESVNWDKVEGDDKSFDPAPFLGYPSIVLWGANHYSNNLPNSPGWLFWDKEIPDGFAASAGDLAWTNTLKTIHKFTFLWSGFRRAGEVGEYYHPTQKPIALMEWCIQLCSKHGDTIFDPFMGSGSTGVACVRTGRSFIGIEIVPEYFERAKQRIEKERNKLMQLRMF